MKNQKNNSRDRVIDHLFTKVPAVAADETIEKVIELVRRVRNWDTVNYIYILKPDKTLEGVVSIKELLRAKNTDLIKKVMIKNPVGIFASAPQERAAVIAIEHNIKTVPVFKTGSREFLGVVGTDNILNILHREHVEKFLRFSGIGKDHPTVDIFKAKPLRMMKLRLPWLLIGLVGGMIASVLISKFEGILKREIALSFFIPVVVYISNAISIQAQALLIRLLASQKVKNLPFIKKEAFVSTLLGIVSAIIISIYAGIWLGSFKIALIVFLAIILSTLAAVLIAITIPLTLYAAKKDPALGSGPFSTAIQDVSTLLIYFLIASLVIF